MIKKKIRFLLITILLISFATPVFATPPDSALLNHLPSETENFSSDTDFSKLTDGIEMDEDEDNYVIFDSTEQSVKYDFVEPSDVTGFHIQAETRYDIEMNLYDENGELLETLQTDDRYPTDSYEDCDVSDVKTVEVKTTSNTSFEVYEISVESDGQIDSETFGNEINTPDNLESSNITDSSVDLNWDSVTNAEGYKIYQDGEEIADTSNTDYTVENLEQNTDYDFQVSAYDSEGNESDKSDPITVTTDETTDDGTELVAPENIQGTESSDYIELNWDSVTGAEEYKIYRNDSEIATVEDATYYKDENLDSDTEYEYQISSLDSEGNESDKSDIITFKTLTEEQGSIVDVLSFDSTPVISDIGDNVSKSISSMIPIWIIPASLIIAASLLQWGIYMFRRFKKY